MEIPKWTTQVVRVRLLRTVILRNDANKIRVRETNGLDRDLEFLPSRQVVVWPWLLIQGDGAIINCQWQNGDHSAWNFLNGLQKLSGFDY